MNKHSITVPFMDREDIGKDRLYELYWQDSGLSKEKVMECLALIELETNVSAGLLRPDDDLSIVLKPIPTSNPLKWLTRQAKASNREDDLSYYLEKKLVKYGTVNAWPEVVTIDDFVRAWCGARKEEGSKG